LLFIRLAWQFGQARDLKGTRGIAVDKQSLATDHYITAPPYLAPNGQPTQTTHLHCLFTPEADQSRAFDLNDIGSASFGNLLDALPVPVLLIDQWFCVAFVNQSCEKLSINYRDMKGSRFTDLLPNPDDAARANTLRIKAMTLLERVFADTRPQKAEAILEIGKHRIWARLHLRSVRVVSDRYIMVIIEDVTSERTHQHAFQKDEKELKKTLVESQERLRQVTRELSETKLELQRETAQNEETKRQLGACDEKQRHNRKRRAKIATESGAVMLR
jgi:PAS domain-containing protein